MTPRIPIVGEAALVHGRRLTVTEITQASGAAAVAVLRDTVGDETRAKARAAIHQLRAQQEAAVAPWNAARATIATAPPAARAKAEKDLAALRQQVDVRHRELAAQIVDQDLLAQAAVFVLRLRLDLLSWWAERQVWVSNGRLLSDAQHEAVAGTGKRVSVATERAVCLMLESQQSKGG